jgi:Putative esterase
MVVENANSSGNTLKIAAAIFIFLLAPFAPPLAQQALAQTVTVSDNFDRADGTLGANWTSLPEGGLALSSGQAAGGAAGQYSGSYRSAESFSANQYSEIEITATPFSSSTHQWIGASVRNNANGDLYTGIYWNNLGGTPVLRLYKRVSGSFTQLGPEYASGTLPAGAKLRVIAANNQVSLLLNGIVKISVFDGDLGFGAPGIMAYDAAKADNWSAGDSAPPDPSGPSASAADNFDRADGTLGANWTSLPEGGLALSSGQAAGGAAGQYSGSYRSAESFSANQYSEIEITATPFSSSTHQWIGASVRNNANGDLYTGIYWNNLGGMPVLRLYKRVSGSFTQLGPEYASGTLPAGAKLRVTAANNQVSLLLNGIVKISVFDGDLGFGAPGIMAYDAAKADNWSAGDYSPPGGDPPPPAPSASTTDNFDRVDGSLGANWTSLPDGGLIILSNQVSGAAPGVISGSMRTGESYDSSQYSEIKTTATQLSGNQWIGPSVRNHANGDLYFGMYWWNNGAPVLRIYKRVSGSFTQLGPEYACGPLSAGTALRLTATGTTISFLQDGMERISVYDGSLHGGSPGIMAFATPSADNWSGGTANFQAYFLGADANGVESYNMSSGYNGYGPHVMRVLRPDNPAPGMAHNFLFVLPVTAEGDDNFGNGMDTVRAVNAQNDYNVTIVEPSFPIPPWYADNPLDPNYRFESFMTLELGPWVKANLATTGHEKIWLLGFSKSGVGALELILKHPDLFTVAAAWDFPADMSTYTQFSADLNYGTEANFQNNYRLTSSFVGARQTPFIENKRIWMSGYNAFQTDVADFDALLASLGIQFTDAPGVLQRHRWDGGWVPGALAGLSEESSGLADITPPAITAFSIPGTAASTTVAISAFTASDDVAVTGYFVSESSTAPAAGASGWSATAPASYTFSSTGSKILYAWAKDAAGNVSSGASASVTISPN